MSAAQIIHRPAPATVPDLQLVPLDTAKQGFVAREPVITQEQLRATDAAVNVLKASGKYFAAADHFALEQQQRGGGL